ncbi:hypothetical protein [Clavibacter nebraskensis]|uniref:Uncharacterized protein n=2 Tax=Clavibacter nebraskensis TaxID=31963 RepID=A0A399PBX1_9MICO|nr:hypothetical protein [Clavibacter nebraskensis]KXU21963.1 hypothetical protein VV38_01170 [Clavibacter nebraskensis]OAH18779.1 hypothetical protein A3Q38_10070 [Clavibacter nebraskensis]QGV65641.1 hypothetical protein EGX36_01530 [Clavibacter nebraskensis]QGV68438.1 hypothetical protein EGX37_01515 [Clavibacter nebraskensis]QGV71229.1 hypothetical protein EGX35_01515 [Clavibacter nebraskensis]
MTSADASGTGGEGGRDEAAAAEVLEALLDAGPRQPVRRAARAIGAVALTVVGMGGDLAGRVREFVAAWRLVDEGPETGSGTSTGATGA